MLDIVSGGRQDDCDIWCMCSACKDLCVLHSVQCIMLHYVIRVCVDVIVSFIIPSLYVGSYSMFLVCTVYYGLSVVAI